ncbi:polyketide synthase [Lentzea albidocapillata]|uniref:Beta-ketoacyl synthase, C-terminal domain n=1 Tax=Lentzea albidocapillata TaxID=40571 RepID=A0A1W1ZNK3_9PSEU|nr:polyketide synthase [Lentzea albidocapillata]SMC50009.1 Beta-ketoacyl synthase, C-terminal domain [Lentzea albidocapillata]
MNTCEPIAIVGMGCRFPGATTPGQLWELICGEVDAMSATAPPSRFDARALHDPAPRRPGRVVSLDGGFLDDTTDFAPGAYFVTERENTTLDPQHRVLLTCAGDALADAGLPPEAIAGRDIGVFMGQSTGEHWDRLQGTTTVDMYAIATAAARSMASGRISYAWDLRGPCTTVDAACSSGTLAVHLACQSLRTGECDTALAGGVSLVLGTDHTVGYSAAGMLSPTGRCRFAHENADGFVRSDGAGVLALKRLSSAQADGDTIHALILGSAQASKGRTAKAIIAPSTDGYLQVITRAAATAGITPDAIGYVEAHGNAAPAGDRLELQAIGATIGAHRPADSPCLVGSVKTNIGHPEAAGGVAGLIKAALAVRKRIVPASLYSDYPTSQVDWAGLNIAPVPQATPWPGNGPAIAGVSSYGLSGTFVHILVGEPPN